jgi:DNA-binding transcriptional MerR regulator
MKYLKTSDIAKEVGIHPNTVRLYEEWGLLGKIPRSPAGYRLFTQAHLDQVRLVRLALKCSCFGREIKRMAYDTIKASAAGDYKEALDTAISLKKMIGVECCQAEEAERYLEQWAVNTLPGENKESDGGAGESAHGTLGMAEAAKLLSITTDTLRNWERNNLIQIPRNPANGYRMYGPDEINRLRVIRVLRRSNYSNMAILRAMLQLESGSSEGLREALDSPELDEERGYLCFTDNLLSTLHTALDAVNAIVLILQSKSCNH